MSGPGRMQQGAPSGGLQRLAPWVGAAVVAMGATQAGLVLTQAGPLDLRMLGTALLITGGGAGLIARRTGARPALFAFLGGALAIAALVVRAATHR